MRYEVYLLTRSDAADGLPPPSPLGGAPKSFALLRHSIPSPSRTGQYQVG